MEHQGQDDDPWDWAVPRVVDELCTQNRTWQPKKAIHCTPDPITFGQILRNEEVSGSVLLTDVKDEDLREFGLKKLGFRSFVRGAIEELRLKSAKYQEHQYRHNPSYQSPSLPLNAPQFYGSYRQPTLIGEPNPNSLRSPFLLPDSPAVTPPQPPNTVDDRSGNFVLDQSGHKRRKLDCETPTSFEENDHAIHQSVEVEIPILENGDTLPQPPTPTPVTGKKPKRIAPILITSEIDPDRNRDVPSFADTVIQNDPHTIEPGVTYIGEDGRKRLVPVLQDSGHNAALNYESRQPRALDEGGVNSLAVPSTIITGMDSDEVSFTKESLAAGYLGKKRLRIDDIFYENTAMGQKLAQADEPRVFCQRPKIISAGRRIYVHHAIKRLLRSERHVISRSGKFFSAIRPYPVQLAPVLEKPSFTLYFANTEGGICAQREPISGWPEIDPEALPVQQDDDDNKFIFGVGNPNDPIPSYGETFDPDNLNKYRHIPGGDELLPLYGESDEENEYDVETWAEIQAEFADVEKPNLPLKRPHLTTQEIEKSLDEGIAEMTAKWHTEHKPRKERKAFRNWRKWHCRDLPRVAKEQHLDLLRERVERVNKKLLPDYRKEILSEIWTSQKQVRKQTRIMEQSLYNRESDIWDIALIQSRHCPEKPPPCPPTSKKSALSATTDGEEGESIGSEHEVSSSDDEMDDFIVDDPTSGEEEHELSLADNEGDGSDGSVYDSQSNRLPLPIRKSSARSASKDVHDSEDDLMPYIAKDSAVSSGRPQDERDRATTSFVLPQTPSTVKPLQKVSKAHGKASGNAYDPVVLSSDAEAGNEPSDSQAANRLIDLTTPTPKKVKITLTNRKSPLASDSEVRKTIVDDDLPPYDKPIAIGSFSYKYWTRRGDRNRLLISVLNWMETKSSLFSYVSNISEEQLWTAMSQLIDAQLAGKEVQGIDKDTLEIIRLFIKLFRIYAECHFHNLAEMPSNKKLKKLRGKHRQKWFTNFFTLCSSAEKYFAAQSSAPPKTAKSISERNGDDEVDDDEPPQSAVKRRRFTSHTDEDSDVIDIDLPSKKRKKLKENEAARDMRAYDRLRIAEQVKRREVMEAKLAAMGDAASQLDAVLNLSKENDQAIISAHDRVAPFIKPHQLEGVRFMWNQIVGTPDIMQGCLLAHTMGLGKTMQVITLLVAIAEAAGSLDESVYSQIPEALRVSRTLVLCPASLRDNWMDELLLWALPDVLGDLRKVDPLAPLEERIRTIHDWYHDGGILIMGYEMFGLLINKKNTESADYDEVKKHLLEGPNIIVADEAHRMKNPKAKATMAAVKFKSQSRIALTGSPLANNVTEYHTMIEWIAPGYLGPAAEFRAKYVVPIHEGLYQDSTSGERRKALKMLGVLTEDLAPKVHRADISVLRDHLPPKQEFVITVPLTELQTKAYIIYVKAMSSTAYDKTRSGGIRQATLWHWLAILSLLCNHPDCFHTKITERKDEAMKGASATAKSKLKAKAMTPSEDGENSVDVDKDVLDVNEPIWKVGVSPELVNEVTELFKAEVPDLKSIELSYKVKILCQILDASKEMKDKVLVFSQHLPSLDYLEALFKRQGRKSNRLDGKTPMGKRQAMMKQFNTGDGEVLLVSTTAGSLGLNIQGANRVIIFDFKFNPIQEEQAVGRAYRIGQQKPVYVYRFVAGGTFETNVHNKAVFKMQLASRVIDKKDILSMATKSFSEYLFPPKHVDQEDLSRFKGMDPVLDMILATQQQSSTIRAIVQTDTFEQDDEDKLTPQEKAEVQRDVKDLQLQRRDPMEYERVMAKRRQQFQQHQQHQHEQYAAARRASTQAAAKAAAQNTQVRKETAVKILTAQDNQIRREAVLPVQSASSPMPNTPRATPKLRLGSGHFERLSQTLRRTAESLGGSSEVIKNPTACADKLAREVFNSILALFKMTDDKFQSLSEKAIDILGENEAQRLALVKSDISVKVFAESLLEPADLAQARSLGQPVPANSTPTIDNGKMDVAESSLPFKVVSEVSKQPNDLQSGTVDKVTAHKNISKSVDQKTANNVGVPRSHDSPNNNGSDAIKDVGQTTISISSHPETTIRIKDPEVQGQTPPPPFLDSKTFKKQDNGAVAHGASMTVEASPKLQANSSAMKEAAVPESSQSSDSSNSITPLFKAMAQRPFDPPLTTSRVSTPAPRTRQDTSRISSPTLPAISGSSRPASATSSRLRVEIPVNSSGSNGSTKGPRKDEPTGPRSLKTPVIPRSSKKKKKHKNSEAVSSSSRSPVIPTTGPSNKISSVPTGFDSLPSSSSKLPKWATESIKDAKAQASRETSHHQSSPQRKK